MQNDAGGAGGTRLEVTPAELHTAAGTLRSVGDSLAQNSELGLGAEELGSAPLAIALSDFCEQARTLNTTFVDVIERTGTNVAMAGSSYTETDANAIAYAGPH